MPDEIVWVRLMTALDLEFKRILHYHHEGHDRDNDYELPGQVMRPVHVYSVLKAEASFYLTDYKGVQCPISLSSHQGDPGMSYLSIMESTNA